jgi:hypothetical protein
MSCLHGVLTRTSIHALYYVSNAEKGTGSAARKTGQNIYSAIAVYHVNKNS